MNHTKRLKLSRIGMDMQGYANDLCEANYQTDIDAVERLSKRLARQIMDTYALYEGCDLEVESRAQFAWSMQEAYGELPKSPMECAFLLSCIEYALLEDHDIDLDAEREARKAKWAAQKYEAGLK